MKTLFALQGAGATGKSDTLIRLYALIKVKYPNASYREFHRGRDVKVIIDRVDGKKIGLESQGDPNSRLSDSLALFKSERCDIIFCACRSSGMTVNFVNSLSPPYKAIFVLQTRVNTRSQQSSSNDKMADMLMHISGL